MGDFYHSNDPASTDYSRKIEELENSKQFQDAIGLIREQMKNNLKWNVLRSFDIICAILSLILLRFAAIPLILLVVGLYYWPQYKKRKALFGDRIRSNDEIYLDDILSPVLKEVFPKASIKEDGSIPSEALSHLCPRSTDFLCFKELSFHDDKELTVSNLYAHHTETRYRTSNGHTRTEHVEVTDFLGQVFSLCLPINFSGHLRVVPTKKSFLFKREVNGVYPGARGDEVQIETEDIRNNENYNIYCTDELSARKFLTPKMLEWFDRQISQNAMCVFLKDKKLFISLYTDRYIFPTPQKPEDIDQLSLVSEYHKLCRELALIKEITAIFEGEAS